MSSIVVRKKFTMPRAKLRKQLDELAARLGEQTTVECCWNSDRCLDFKLNGAQGQFNIEGKEVELNVRLGLLLRPFKARIEQEIEKFFEEHVH